MTPVVRTVLRGHSLTSDEGSIGFCVGQDDHIDVGVHTLHLPGHTAGSMGLLVEAPDGRHVLTGDAVCSAAALRRGQCSVVHHDAEQARVRDRQPADYLEPAVPIGGGL